MPASSSRTLLIPVIGLATALTLSARAAPAPRAQRAASPATSGSSPQDWPQWRGVNRDGVATAFTEPKAWPEQLALKWKVDVGLDIINVPNRAADQQFQSGGNQLYNTTNYAIAPDGSFRGQTRQAPRSAQFSIRFAF